MPSFPHELLVELFRNRPQLASELLRDCFGVDLEGNNAELSSVDLSQITPTEFRADAVTVLRDESGVARSAVIVEVQLQPDDRKHLTWPLYIAALRVRLECPVALLVLAPDPAVATWARIRIETGHPRFGLEPVVLSFADVPRVLDGAVAERQPELAVLSTISHPQRNVATVAARAIEGLPSDVRKLYLDVILGALSYDIGRAVLEDLMASEYEPDSDWARNIYDWGIRRGIERGLAQGREEGREEGREDALRTTAVELVRLKVGADAAFEQRVARLQMPALHELVLALAAAQDRDAALAAIERLAQPGD